MKKALSILFSIIILIFCICLTATVYADEEVEASDSITVDLSVKSIKLAKNEFKLGLKETYQLIPKNQDDIAITSGLTYESNNTNIVSVSSKGVVKAKKIGESTVTVKYKNGKKITCKITVKNAPSSVTLDVTSATIGVNEKSLDLTSTTHNGFSKQRKYTSSDTKVAKVNSYGVVTGVSKGTAVITCETFNGKTASCKITVKKEPESITITNDNKKVQKGTNQYKIKTKLTSGSASYKISYKSSDSKVATVSSKGVVKGIKKGKATITVTAFNGINAKINISVVNENNCLSLNKVATQISYDYDNVKKYVFGKSSQGRNLEAYIITPEDKKYEETYVMTFAIHGFEDSYKRDGKVLVEEANKLIEYYAENPEKLKSFRLVIVPCLNPDGTIAGENNLRACSDAFGRCTAKHIDMNRDFKSGRFKATESRSMRKLLEKYKPDVFTDFHGWLDEVYGTSAMCSIFQNNMNLSGKGVNYYGKDYGYIVAYVHNKYSCPAALVEYTSPKKVNHKNTYTSINKIIKKYSSKKSS